MHLTGTGLHGRYDAGATKEDFSIDAGAGYRYSFYMYWAPTNGLDKQRGECIVECTLLTGRFMLYAIWPE